jgi:hypothetical protein
MEKEINKIILDYFHDYRDMNLTEFEMRKLIKEIIVEVFKVVNKNWMNVNLETPKSEKWMAELVKFSLSLQKTPYLI